MPTKKPAADAHPSPTKKRGGARPGAGKPPLGPEGSVAFNMKMTPSQRAKLQKLGGAAWVRSKVEQAKIP